MLTEQEAAERVKVSPRTIRRLIQAGRLEAVNFATGRERARYRIHPDALARVTPPAEPAEAPRRRRRRPVPVGDTPVW